MSERNVHRAEVFPLNATEFCRACTVVCRSHSRTQKYGIVEKDQNYILHP